MVPEGVLYNMICTFKNRYSVTRENYREKIFFKGKFKANIEKNFITQDKGL